MHSVSVLFSAFNVFAVSSNDFRHIVGYWKFNEGAGNTIKDYSRYHNDGEAEYDLVWPDGVEIPKINETEE